MTTRIGEIQTSVHINGRLWRMFKSAIALDGFTVQAKLEELIRKYLADRRVA